MAEPINPLYFDYTGRSLTGKEPLLSADQLAYLLGQYVWGSGVADAAGQMPVMPTKNQSLLDAVTQGERGLSARENFNQGNYFTSLFQALGAGGDALYAVPIVGPAAGAALKTLRNVQQVVNSAQKVKDAATTKRFAGNIPEVNRETGLLQRVGDADLVNALDVGMTPSQLSPVPIVKAEDLVDRIYTSGIVDTTRSGRENVYRINNVEIPDGGRQYGGAFYGFQPENLEKGAIFANTAKRDVSTIFNKAGIAKELFPNYASRPPLFIPHGMLGKSPDFSTMVTGLQVPYSKQTMSQSAKKALDKRIREGYMSTTGKNKGKMVEAVPKWPGIDSPEALNYLETIGGNRKKVSKAIDEFRADGALTLSEARAIITDPSQFDPRHGAVNAVYEMDMSKGVGLSSHPSYPTDFYGNALGAFREGANVMQFKPRYQQGLDYIADRASKGSFVTPNMENFPSAKSTFGGLFGVIDRDMVDDMIAKGLVIP